jgi:hypothetical protein
MGDQFQATRQVVFTQYQCCDPSLGVGLDAVPRCQWGFRVPIGVLVPVFAVELVVDVGESTSFGRFNGGHVPDFNGCGLCLLLLGRGLHRR